MLDQGIQDVLNRHKATSFVSSFVYHPSMSSTNDVAHSLINHGKMSQGGLVLTDYQTKGRGRLNHRWESRPGDDILMSLVLQPHAKLDDWPRVLFVVSLAIHNALSIFLKKSSVIQLKWPNDLLIEGKKFGGLLSERVSNHLILGIGINVNQIPNSCERSSLAFFLGHSMERHFVLDALLTAFNQAMPAILCGDLSVQKWNKHAAYLGKTVRFNHGSQTITGVFRGIDEGGCMVVEDTNMQRSTWENGCELRPI